MGDVITYPLEQVNSAIPIGTNGQTVRYVGSILVPTSFLYNSGSRIGIGTSTPGYTLDVVGTGNFSGALTASSISGTSMIASKWYPSADSTTALQILKANGTTSIVNIDTTNNRVGINKTDPSYPLDVVGNIYTTGSLFVSGALGGFSNGGIQGNTNIEFTIKNVNTGVNASMSFYTQNTEKARILANGNFAIGATTASYLLDVNGLARFSTGFLSPKWYPVSDSTTAIQINKADGTTNVMTVDTTNGRVGIGTNAPSKRVSILSNADNMISTSVGDFEIIQPTDNLYKLSIGLSNNGSYGYIFSARQGSGYGNLVLQGLGGKVGIGTTTPTEILSIGGTAARTIWMERNTTAATAGQGLTLSSGGAIAGTADLAGGDVNIKSGISTGTGTSAIRFFTATASTTGTADNVPTEKMTILGNGYVGIKNNNPLYALDVTGTINSTSRIYAGIEMRTPLITADGNTNLDIKWAFNWATSPKLLTLTGWGASGASANINGGDIYIKSGQSSGTGSSALRFFTTTAGSSGSTVNSPTEKMTLLGSGFLGLNTTAPQAKLDVNGGTRLGDSTTNYTAFSATGHQTMVGNARPWRDELSDAVNLQQTGPGVSRNSTEASVEYTTGANLSDYMYANIQLNHDKDLTSSIYPHIHFWQAGAGIPNFLLQYRWQVDGGAKVTSWTNLACNTAAYTYTSGTINQIAYSAAIAVPVGTTLSDIVQFRILRDNANTSTVFTGADPYSGTVGVLAFDIHFQINSLGSDDQYTK